GPEPSRTTAQRVNSQIPSNLERVRADNPHRRTRRARWHGVPDFEVDSQVSTLMTTVIGAAYPASGHPVPNQAPAPLPNWSGHPLSSRTVTVAGWPILAIGLSFAEAIARLGAKAVTLVRAGLSPAEWIALAGSVLLFTWFEGHRALHRRFVPAVVRR